MDEKPCCAADALRKIRRIDVGGVAVGITMLDSVLAEVHAMNLTGEKEIGDELVKRVRIYNYVPPRAEEHYRAALVREYATSRKRGV
ncbi:MAG: hypothetical protein GKC05_01670 [Methanomicrobiales archaeon]|nr:hypothetical protein [Methanomicrobiales archaeon]NYT20288.1 hypothetical protein [Methanomicrobiales archaeon]